VKRLVRFGVFCRGAGLVAGVWVLRWGLAVRVVCRAFLTGVDGAGGFGGESGGEEWWDLGVWGFTWVGWVWWYLVGLLCGVGYGAVAGVLGGGVRGIGNVPRLAAACIKQFYRRAWIRARRGMWTQAFGGGHQ